jgi:pectate lyase
MRRQNGTNTSTTEFDAFTALSGIQDDSTNNAPLFKLDPADPAVFWYPSKTYSYVLMPVDSDVARAALRAEVIGNAGAGKLD